MAVQWGGGQQVRHADSRLRAARALSSGEPRPPKGPAGVGVGGGPLPAPLRPPRRAHCNAKVLVPALHSAASSPAASRAPVDSDL